MSHYKVNNNIIKYKRAAVQNITTHGSGNWFDINTYGVQLVEIPNSMQFIPLCS